MQNTLVNLLSQGVKKSRIGFLYVSKTRKEATVKFVIGLALTYISYKGFLYLMFKKGLINIPISVLSYLCFVIGITTISSSFFKLVFNINALNFEGNTTDELQKTDSMPLILYWFTTFLFMAIPWKGCNDFINKTKSEQLHFYGKTVKVKIDEVYKRYKSGYYAKFSFYNNGEYTEQELSANDFKEGDSVYVTFSTQNSNIVVWTYEKQKEAKEQLLNHYKWQRIIVNDIYTDSILGQRAKFTYENYGDYFESNLPAKKHKIGDTVEIIFSKENTNIMGWTYDEAVYQ